LILVFLFETQFFALSYSPIAQEHHEDDYADVDKGADDIPGDHHIVIFFIWEIYAFNPRVKDDCDDLVDECHCIEDQVKLSETIGIAHEPDDAYEGHDEVDEDVRDL
jgi:hypothetical protein